MLTSLKITKTINTLPEPFNQIEYKIVEEYLEK